ncbi:MAG: hypothetical protein ACWGO1_16035, partial [Anaerolineales bacterium]
MTDILTNLSQPVLARAAKNNLYRFFETLRGWQRAEFYEIPAFLRWGTPLPHPWYNGVFSRKPPEGDETQRIQETLAYFRNRGIRAITWWLAPELEESDWSRQLLQNGLGSTDDPPGMAVDLSLLNES